MLALALCPALAGCGDTGRGARDNGADIANAASRAQATVAGYAAQRRAARAPSPAATPVAETRDATRPATVDARYACGDAVVLNVRFDNRAGTASLRRGDAPPATLEQQRAASGIWYAGGGWELRGKGDAATITPPGGAAMACRAAAAAAAAG